MDDQAVLAWVAWLYTRLVYSQMVVSSCRATLLMCPLPSNICTKTNLKLSPLTKED